METIRKGTKKAHIRDTKGNRLSKKKRKRYSISVIIRVNARALNIFAQSTVLAGSRFSKLVESIRYKQDQEEYEKRHKML